MDSVNLVQFVRNLGMHLEQFRELPHLAIHANRNTIQEFRLQAT
jgi:hypothetical protein